MNTLSIKWFAFLRTTRRIIASGATYRACSEAALLASGWTMEAGECAPYVIVGAAWLQGQTQTEAIR